MDEWIDVDVVGKMDSGIDSFNGQLDSSCIIEVDSQVGFDIPSRSSSPEIPEPTYSVRVNSSRIRPVMHVVQEDLSCGQELYPIRVFNDVNDETVAPFQYIKSIETFQNYKRTPVVCDCEGGCDNKCRCMYDSIDCSFCDIPYIENTGRLSVLTNKFVNSHRIVWECSAECRCGSECPSRSAQLGCRLQLEVFRTSKKGWGVRPRRDVLKGSFIAEYSGQMKEAKDGYEYSENDWYSFDITTETGVTNFYIDASAKGNVARFLNHSCEPNLIAVHVFYDDNNPQMGMHICFYASKDIAEGEEMCFDYGPEYWHAKKKQRIGCECGSKKCLYRQKKKVTRRKRRPAKVVWN